MTKAHNDFLTYIRTKQFFQLRLRQTDPIQPVFMPMGEIKSRFFVDPRKEIDSLVQSGKLIVTEHTSKNSHQFHKYQVTESGAVNLRLLKPQPQSLTPLQASIKDNLRNADLKQGSPSTLYFDAFLKFKRQLIDLFFKVDDFAGRIHTPVSNFHREYRANLLLEGSETTSIDVVTMQPVLLGLILGKCLGRNQYSDWINSGEDIYIMLQDKADLKSRDEAKKLFFEILFSKPSDRLSGMFGQSSWIEWINEIKRRPLKHNPHSIEKNHSNLAWLLQTTEVKLMSKVWKALTKARVPFLTVHDEVIVKDDHAEYTTRIFSQVLASELPYFKLNRKLKKESKPETDQSSKADWTREIHELETYFSSNIITLDSIHLDNCTTITNPHLFIQNHLYTIKANNGKRTFEPYLERLRELSRFIDKFK